MAAGVLLGAWQDLTLGLLYHQCDLGNNLLAAQRLLDGEYPYRDFIWVYPPLGLLLTAASFVLLGSSLWAAKVPLALAVALSVFLAYRWLRAAFSREASVAGAAVIVLAAPIALRLPYPLNLTLAPALLAFQQLERLRPGRLVGPAFLAGIGCGLTLGLKHNVGALVGVAILVRLFLVSPFAWTLPLRAAPNGTVLRLLSGALATASLVVLIRRFGGSISAILIALLPAALVSLVGGWAAVRTRTGAPAPSSASVLSTCGALAAGTSLITVPWVLWLWSVDALGPFLGLGLIDFRRADAGWGVLYSTRLGARLPGAEHGYLLAALALALCATLSRRRMVWWVSSVGTLLVLASALAGFGVRACEIALEWGPLGAVLFALWVRSATRPFLMACSAAWFLALCYPASTIQHGAIGLAPSLALATAWAFTATRRRWIARLAIVGLLGFPLLTGWMEWAGTVLRPTAQGWRFEAPVWMPGPRGGTLVSVEAARELQAVEAAIDALRPGGVPVVAWPSLGIVNFLSARPCATSLHYYWPGYVSPTVERRLIAELERAGLPLIALRLSSDPSLGHEAFLTEAPHLGELLDRRYRPSRKVGPWILLVPRLPAGPPSPASLTRGRAPATPAHGRPTAGSPRPAVAARRSVSPAAHERPAPVRSRR